MIWGETMGNERGRMMEWPNDGEGWEEKWEDDGMAK